jgi:hypothetical protein
MEISEFQNVLKFKFGEIDERLRQLDWISPALRNDGLNLEFGVFNGTTINRLANNRQDLIFHGFDSFEGLPEDWDLGGKFCNKEKFDRSGIMPKVHDNVKLYKGWFDETLPKFLEENDGHASFVHVDSDVYSSAKVVFDLLNDRIIPGTIIVFDELACWRHVFKEASPSNENRVLYTTWEDHEWKAFNEWLETYNRKVIPISRTWFQQAAVVVTQ